MVLPHSELVLIRPVLFDIAREKINQIHVTYSIDCQNLIRVYHVIINNPFHCTNPIKSKIFKFPPILGSDFKLKVMFVFGFKLFLHPQHTLNLLLCFMLLSFRLLFVLMLGPLPILSLFLLEKVQIDFLYLFILLLFFPLVTHCSELLIEDVDRTTRQITKVVELQRALLRQKAEVVGVRSVE